VIIEFVAVSSRLARHASPPCSVPHART